MFEPTPHPLLGETRPQAPRVEPLPHDSDSPPAPPDQLPVSPADRRDSAGARSVDVLFKVCVGLAAVVFVLSLAAGAFWSLVWLISLAPFVVLGLPVAWLYFRARSRQDAIEEEEIEESTRHRPELAPHR